MTPNKYQKEAHKTAKYSGALIVNENESKVGVGDYVYPALGLAEEAGEVAGKFAKAVRDESGIISDERKEAIIKELGDVCWFIAELCTLMEVDLETVMQKNLDKLADRAKRGVISGSGDNR